MGYIVQSSEKTSGIGNGFETKALLYLMNFMDDSADIHYYAIDFFNDLTGFDRFINKSWDLQSKAKKNNYQSDIGKELVTLFKNYISEFEFDGYLLFLGGVSDSIRLDNTKNLFDFTNIKPVSQQKIKKALINECDKKTYIDSTLVTENNINDFLNLVTFIIDDKEKHEYIRSIIKLNPKIIPKDPILEEIFNNIRDEQSAKKNINVEGLVINSQDEFINTNKYLTSHQIKILVLNRIVNNDFMSRGITPAFSEIYSRLSHDSKRKEALLEDCQHAVAKVLFDKNNAENFWNLFSDIYEIFEEGPLLNVNDAYRKMDSTKMEKIPHLDILSMKYFMALVKDGMDYDN